MKIRTIDAVAFFGSKTELAAALEGCSLAAVCQWGEYVPRGRVYEIHHKSDGALGDPEVSDVEAAG